MSTYEVITLACFITAGVFFVISVVLFFVLDMVKVIGDLTGHTAKREIENIRSQNQITGNKAYKPSKVNAERGKLTDKISPSGKIESKHSAIFGGSVGTEKISPAQQYSGYEATTLLEGQQDGDSLTTVLDPTNENLQNETTVLNGAVNETTVLNQAASETTVLNNAEDNTTVLNNAGQIDETSVLNANIITVAVSILQEIKFINTEEIIL